MRALTILVPHNPVHESTSDLAIASPYRGGRDGHTRHAGSMHAFCLSNHDFDHFNNGDRMLKGEAIFRGDSTQL